MMIALKCLRRLSAQLMLVAVLALTLQGGVIPAFAHCSDDRNSYQVAGSVAEVGSIEHVNVDHAHHANLPCKSACCGAACSLALLGAQATIAVPKSIAEILAPSTLLATKSTDLKALSRPPKARLFV